MDLMKVPLKNPQNFENCIPENQILSLVSKIESSIYDKSFSYFGQNILNKFEGTVTDDHKIIDENSRTFEYINNIINNPNIQNEEMGSEESNELPEAATGKIKKPSTPGNKMRRESVDDDFDSIGSGIEDEKENYKEMEYIENLKSEEGIQYVYIQFI